MSACASDAGQPTLTGQVRSPRPSVASIALPDATGKSIAMKAPARSLLLVYFGYTSCPDVCPTTLADVKAALGRLGNNAERVTLAMITVDPARDDAQQLDRYVKWFAPTAYALRTDNASALRSAADAFGASFSVSTSNGAVEVTHSAWLYAVDAAGEIVIQWPFGSKPNDMAADLKAILQLIDTKGTP